MGNDISTDLTPPPLKLHDCVVDGKINLAKYYYYRRRLDYRQQILNTHEIRRRKKGGDYQVMIQYARNVKC